MLASQNNTVASIPNVTLFGSNLSNTAGRTTEARVIKPISDAISDNLSICLLFNLILPILKIVAYSKDLNYIRGNSLFLSGSHIVTLYLGGLEQKFPALHLFYSLFFPDPYSHKIFHKLMRDTEMDLRIYIHRLLF